MRGIVQVALLFGITKVNGEVRRQLHDLPLQPNVQRSKECPAGFELSGKTCIATEILTPSYVCPPGTTDHGGRCAVFATANRVCPNGSQLTGGRCLRVDSLPAERTCDEGEITGNSCKITTPVPSVCPPGYQDVQGQCLRKSPVEKVCPAGYSLNGKECSSRESYDATPTCPADLHLVEGPACQKEVPVPPRCAPGFTLVNESACEKTLPRVPAPCPAGYTAFNTECRSRSEFPTRPVCAEGYTLIGTECQKVVAVPPTCPPGTSPGPAQGQCNRPVPKRPVCTGDEKLVGGSCQRDAFYHSELECPSTFALIHGKCKKVDKFPSALKCSNGALKDDSCVTQNTSLPQLQCEPGYQLVKGPKCAREVSYDCSKRTTSNECDMPEFVRGIEQGNYKSKTAAVSKTVEQKDPASKTPHCAPVTRVIPETCTKTEESPVKYVCADGSAPQGKNCFTTKATPAEVFCPKGQFDRATGECVIITVLPAKRVCPAGTLRPDNNCQETKTRPADQVCPENSQPLGSGCAVVVPHLVRAPNVLKATPAAVCDVGIKEGGVCVVKESIPRGTVCPPGAEDRGSCIATSPVIYSEPNIVKRPVAWVCADGPTTGPSCSRVVVAPASYVCPEGAQQGNACVTTANRVEQPPKVAYSPARPVCTKGYELHGAQCTAESSFPPTLECPAGYAASGKGECSRESALLEVCPPGTTKSEAGCVKKTYVPPRVTEVKVCTKGEPGC